MNNSEKALMYDALVSEGDILNRRKSKLKSNFNLSNEDLKEIEVIDKRLMDLERKLNQLLK